MYMYIIIILHCMTPCALSCADIHIHVIMCTLWAKNSNIVGGSEWGIILMMESDYSYIRYLVGHLSHVP